MTYPTALDTAASLHEAVNNLASTVNAQYTSPAATLTLADNSGFPSGGGIIYVGGERGTYTGKSGADLTGVAGLSNNYGIGITVEMLVDAAYHNDLRAALIAVETKVGINGSGDAGSHDYKIAQKPALTGTAPVALGSAAAGTASDAARSDHVHPTTGLELTANKDATGGYAGLTLFKLNLKNVAGTFINFFTNTTTAARTWTLPDKDGTVAMTSDITGTNSGTNTGDETGARIATIHHAASVKSALVDADEITGQDSADSFGLIRTTWTSVKAFLKTYNDTLYAALAGLSTQVFSVAAATAAAHATRLDQLGVLAQNSQSTAYTLVLTDGYGKHLLHPSADTTARTFTIPANASVAYPVGTALTFVNQASAGVLTLAITSDTMRLAGAGTTGSRTLAANGIATALKLTATEWIVSGTGLT